MKDGKREETGYVCSMVKVGDEEKMFGYPLKDTPLDSPLIYVKNMNLAEMQAAKCTYLESDTAKGRADRHRANEFRLTKKRWPEQIRKYAKVKKMKLDNLVDPQKEILKEMVQDHSVAFECFSDNRRYMINNARICGNYGGLVEMLYEDNFLSGRQIRTPFFR